MSDLFFCVFLRNKIAHGLVTMPCFFSICLYRVVVVWKKKQNGRGFVTFLSFLPFCFFQRVCSLVVFLLRYVFVTISICVFFVSGHCSWNHQLFPLLNLRASIMESWAGSYVSSYSHVIFCCLCAPSWCSGILENWSLHWHWYLWCRERWQWRWWKDKRNDGEDDNDDAEDDDTIWACSEFSTPLQTLKVSWNCFQKCNTWTNRKISQVNKDSSKKQ